MPTKITFILRLSISLLFVLSFFGLNELNDVVQAQVPVIIRVSQQGSKQISCGATWANACDLQYALTTRTEGAEEEQWEIWVKQGTYCPTNNPTDREATFALKNNVALFGGFNGAEVSRDQRDWNIYPSILSGDIDQNDLASPAENASQIVGGNSYHVVTAISVTQNILLDGFVISGGKADGNDTLEIGGGVFVDSSSALTIRNTRFTGNYASDHGGGLFDIYSSYHIEHCQFQGNEAELGGGLFTIGGQPSLFSNSFVNNSAQYGGGIYFATYEPLQIESSSFIRNKAYGLGGGIYSYDGSTYKLVNVTLAENTAGGAGGVFASGSNVTMLHVTLLGNHATAGFEEMVAYYSTVDIKNSIIWNLNKTQDFFAEPEEYFTTVTASHSIIRQAPGTVYPGEGNINQDPLTSAPVNYGGSTFVLPLLPGSPAIDAADDSDGTCLLTDQRGLSRPQGEGCDIGAFERLQGHYAIYLPVLWN